MSFGVSPVNYSDSDSDMQKMGTAMGSPMSPAYSSLFMGKLEQQFLASRDILPSVWLRFLDDIFMVWDHSLESLHCFGDALNLCFMSCCLKKILCCWRLMYVFIFFS